MKNPIDSVVLEAFGIFKKPPSPYEVHGDKDYLGKPSLMVTLGANDTSSAPEYVVNLRTDPFWKQYCIGQDDIKCAVSPAVTHDRYQDIYSLMKSPIFQKAYKQVHAKLVAHVKSEKKFRIRKATSCDYVYILNFDMDNHDHLIARGSSMAPFEIYGPAGIAMGFKYPEDEELFDYYVTAWFDYDMDSEKLTRCEIENNANFEDGVVTEAFKFINPAEMIRDKKIADHLKKQPKREAPNQPRTRHMIVAKKGGSHVDIDRDPFWSKVCDTSKMDEVHLFIDTKSVPEGHDLALYAIMTNKSFQKAFAKVHEDHCVTQLKRMQTKAKPIQYNGCRIKALHAKAAKNKHIIVSVEFIGPHIQDEDIRIKYDFDCDTGRIVGGVDEYIGKDKFHVMM